MMRVLLTGFGAFMGIEENVSEKIVKDIKRKWRNRECRLKALVMPVEWTRTEQLLEKELSQYCPDVIIAAGLAETYDSLTIESKYFNIAEYKDNLGEIRRNGTIKEDGAVSYTTNVNVLNLQTHLRNSGIPVSLHGGPEGMNYLCNFAAYIIAYNIEKANRRGKCKFVFIHLPSPQDVEYETLLLGVKEVIDFIVHAS